MNLSRLKFSVIALGAFAIAFAFAGLPGVADAASPQGSLSCVDSATSSPLPPYNDQKYEIKIGETANCTITGATDANGLTTTTVTIKSSNGGNTNVTGTVSGTTISFSWTAPAGGCDTVVISWTDKNGGTHNIATDPGGFGYVGPDGTPINCGGPAPSPDVGVSKSDNVSGSVTAGGSFNWQLTITVANGPTSATVTDAVPAGFAIGSVTDDAPSISCTTSSQTVTCSLSSTPTGTYHVTIPVTAPSASPATNCKQYTNTANVSNGGGSNTQNDSSSDSVTVLCPAQPDVAISKSDNTSHSIHAGGTFDWTLGITVTNGPATATISDTVPTGFSIGTVTDDDASISCSTSSQTVTCNLTSTPTGSYTVTIPVTAPDGSPGSECTSFDNTATITQGGGTNAQNDSDSDSVTVTCPDVGVTKSDSAGGAVQAGGGFNWLLSVSVTNGPASATIQDTVPANFSIGTVTASAASISCGTVSQTVTCTLTNTPTGTYTVTIPVTAPAASTQGACASHENDVFITAGGGTNSSNDSDSDSVMVTCPDVGISKTNDVNGSVAAGGSFNWIIPITVTNGPASATVSDTIPAGFTVGTPTDQNSSTADESTISCGKAGQVVTCTLTDTPSGSYKAIIPVTAPSASVDNCKAYENDASITAGGGTNGNNDSASNSVTVLCPAQPDIGISKTDDTQGSVRAGGGFNWSLTVTVTNGPASGTIVDNVPAGFAIGTVTDANSTPADEATITCSPSGQTVTCTLSSTPSGTYTITIPVTAPAATVADACSSHNNVANITTGGGTNSSNDSAQDAVTVVCPDVGVAKSDDTQGSIHAGGSFNWLVTITVTNGPASATVQDAVPANFSIGSVSDKNSGDADEATISCSPSGQTVTCSLTNTPSGTYTVTIPVTAPAASTQGACADHENDVVVTTGGGTDVTNDSASDMVGVTCPDVGVFKSNDAGGSIAAGGSFTWTVTVGVTNGPASGTIVDTVPAGFDIGTVTSNDASIVCGTVAQTVTCTLTNTPTGNYAVSIPVTAPDDNPASNCTQYTNNVSITDGGGTSDANDSSSDPMTVVCPGQAVLSIVKSGNATVVTGNAVIYGVTVTNTSALGANSVVVTDDLPNSLTGISATFDVDPTTAGGTGSCSIAAGNVVTCNIGALAASDGNTASPEADVVQVSISATVPGCATITNQATLTYSTDGSAQPATTVDSNIVTTSVTCGSITIVKNAVPNSAQDFGFTGDLGAFALDDDGNNNNGLSNTIVFNQLASDTYVVTENVTAGWHVDSITCSDGSTTSVTTRSAVIQLAPGEVVTCTFTNVADPVTLPITPPVIPSAPPPANVTTVTALPPLVSQVQSAVSIPGTTQPATPGLISEVEGVRSLPSTGSGGYLDPASKTGAATWLALIAAAVGFSFLLLRFRRGAR